MLISKRLPVKSVYRACGQCIRFNSSVPTVQSSRIYCQNLLQKRDYPSYLQIPFIPESARDAHLAICALNVEMALIPDQISNQYARGMRMQFWKDAVENCFQGKPKAEPVSILLAHVLQSESVQLTKSFFQTIITERSATLSPPPIPNLDALESHLSKTTTPVLYLLLESLGLRSLELDHIASHLGLCAGIVATLRGIPFRIKHNELPLPLDLCARHHLVQEAVFRHGPQATGLNDVVLEVATRANDQLSTARMYIEEARKKDKRQFNSAMCVFLPIVASREYLAWLEKVDFDPFVLQPKDWKLPYRMWRANWSKTL